VNPRLLRHRDYLEHMLEALQLVRAYTEGLSKVDFLNDRRPSRPSF